MKTTHSENTIKSAEQLHYERKWRSDKRINKLVQLLVFICFLVCWETASGAGWIDSFFFSSPSLIIRTCIRMLRENHLMMHISITMCETLISFSLVISISLILAVMFWYFNRLSTIFEPYLVVLNSIPKSALAPLFIVWLGTGMKTIIVAGISVAIFGSIISLYVGFRQSDPGKERLIYTLGGKKQDVLTKVILPGSIPLIISTMKVNIGLSLVGVIIGEFLAARAGLGYLIIYGSQTFKMNMVISSLTLLCVIAIFLFCLIDFVEKMLFRKKSW